MTRVCTLLLFLLWSISTSCTQAEPDTEERFEHYFEANANTLLPLWGWLYKNIVDSYGKDYLLVDSMIYSHYEDQLDLEEMRILPLYSSEYAVRSNANQLASLTPADSALAALYFCDRVSLNESSFAILQEWIENTAQLVGLPHAYLAIHLMEERSCIDNIPKEILKSDALTIKRMKQIFLKYHTSNYDLAFENLAIYLLRDGRVSRKISKAANYLFAKQNEDGGLSHYEGENTSDEHTTLLAYWCYLQLNYKSKSNFILN